MNDNSWALLPLSPVFGMAANGISPSSMMAIDWLNAADASAGRDARGTWDDSITFCCAPGPLWASVP